MKLIRKNEKGLQVLKLRMSAPDKAGFTLFPMIHIADRAFFKHVRSHAHSHDAVFMEGVRAFAGRTASFMHRLAASGSQNLASQSRVFREITNQNGGDNGKIFNSDIAPDEFRKNWSKIPLVRRIFFHVVILLAGLAIRFMGVRNLLIENLAKPDRPAPEDFDMVFGEGFHNAIMESRDAALLAHCETAVKTRADEEIAVVWGAAHMPQLVKALTKKHGYEIVRRDWITAIAA